MKKKYELGGGPGMPPAISKNYSNGIKVGNFIFTAGQAALDEKGELVVRVLFSGLSFCLTIF